MMSQGFYEGIYTFQTALIRKYTKFIFKNKKGRKIMLTITARIFKDNQLVGYQLSDGNVSRRFSKLETWMYAKNKVIANVIATGTGTSSDPYVVQTN